MDGLSELAALIEVPTTDLEAAIGGPWSAGEPGSSAWGEFTIFTGRENPRTPGRPLVAIRVDHVEQTVEIGHAVGVPLPNGRMQWALGEPRNLIPFHEDGLHEWCIANDRLDVSQTPDGLRDLLFTSMSVGIAKVAEVAMLRGTSW